MPVDINELRRLLASATPGPWKAERNEHDQVVPSPGGKWRLYEKGCAVASVNIGKTEARDVDLMAAAVNALPALLDELEAARKVVEAARSCDDGESLYEFASAIGYSDAGKALCDALDAYGAATKR